jgi:excinuclease ABC subunit A
MHGLVDRGNTVVVIEHNLDVIKTADYVIDLGPEGGSGGGYILGTGTPEDIARIEGSATAYYLAKILGKRNRAYNSAHEASSTGTPPAPAGRRAAMRVRAR